MRLEPSRTQHQIRLDARAGTLPVGELSPPESVLVADELGYALAPEHGDGPLPHGAYLLGVARRAVAEALRHTTERRQFGTPLTRFQAVTFPLAEHHIRLAGLRWRMLEAATTGDVDPELVSLVRRRAMAAVDHAVHVHGARGLLRETTVSRCHSILLAEHASDATRSQDATDASDAMARRVPTDWCGTVAETADSTGKETIAALFTRSVARFPEHVAVIGEDRTLTYRELDARADRIAHALRAAGLGRDTVVAVLLPRGPELVAAVLGILKAGDAYLPIDPDYPAERVRFMLDDSGTPLVLTEQWLVEWLPVTTARVVCVDRDLAGADEAPPPLDGRGSDLAYLMYTSGSTGTPKGVLVEQRSVVNRLRWDQERFPLGPDDVVLHHHSPAFDVAVWEMFAPLASGARLALAQPGGSADPDYLTSVIHEHGVTALTFVPSLLDVLLDAEPGLAAPSLRYLFSGGETLSPALCERVFAAVPWARLVNFYGPTEATVDVTWWEVTPENLDGGVPIGRPLDNVRVYVLDDFGEPVPPGYVGELCVGGVGVARGYHNRPDLDRSRFPADRFLDRPGARMYRTGDLVRHRSDGALEFLGRMDNQVKVRGFRVELDEIGAVLERHDAVRRAVITSDGDRLTAHVVGDGLPPDGAALLAFLRETLPEHMVPSAVSVLAELPLTHNGKVDRAALRPAAAEPVDAEPVSEIAALMGEVLGRRGVRPDDDFFALGGTSLQAARFVTRARRRLGVRLDLPAFLEEPTCQAILR